MKANLLLVLLSVCVFNFCGAQSPWTQQSSPTKNNLKAISFYNARIGFAVGDLGTVLRTKNGGQTWESLKFPVSDDLISVTLLDSGIVIVTTASYTAEPAVYRSSNAGVSWQRVLSDVRNFYAAKTPAQRLFSVSDNIYESDNAGKKWKAREDLNNTSTYSYIGFANEQTGMVTGNISGALTYSTEFIRSADCGKTWYNSFPYDFPNANGFSTMDFVNADTAFLFTNFYKGYSPGDSCQLIMLSGFHLRKGLSDYEWHFNSKIVVPSFPDRLNACKFFGSGTAYTISEKGMIYSSANYGKNWKNEYTGKAILHGIYMLNENTGFAVGDGGLIFKRENAVKNIVLKQLLPVKLFPNPAADKATLSFSLDKQLKISVQVTNERGNILLAQPAKGFEKGLQQISLPVAVLHRGTYQVNLLADGAIIGNARLVIVR